MEPTELILFLVLALVAEVLGTIGGFGSSLFFVPVAGLFFEFHIALAITGLFHITSNISKVILFHKGIVWRSVLFLGIASVLSVLIGAWLSTTFDGKILKILLGIFLIALSSLFLLKNNITLKPTKGSLVLGGLTSGFAAGLFGTGGAIRGLALASFGLGKDAFVATSALIDLGVDVSRTGIYYFEGYFDSVSLQLLLWLVVISALGSYLGKLILAKISEQQFRLVVLWLIFGVGIFTIGSLFVEI